MRQTGTYKTVDELPNLLTKEKPQQTYQSVDELPDLKKKVSGDGLKEPSDGVLGGTTPKTEPIPTITQDKLDEQDDVIGKIQEADALSKKTRFWGMGGGGGEVPDFDAISKSKEIHNQLKGMGYGDNDIELLTKTFSDLPKEAETRSVMQQDGTVAYPYSKKSFLELYKTNPIAAVTKANNVKNFYELRSAVGEAKASEYNKLAYVNDETKPINANIDNFNQLKEKQKELINSSLPKEKRQKALDRVEENSDIILSNIFQDENNAKNYLIGKLQQKDATLKLANPTVMEAEGKVDGDLGKFSLESIADNLDPKNKAENLAFRKYKYSVDLDNAVNSSADLNQAALTFAAEHNPQIKGQLEKLGGTRLPNAYEGEIVNEFLNSPDVIKRAESDPIFAEKYNIAKSNLYFNYPDFAKKEVATKISQEMEDRGMTNWFANILTKEGTDKLVDDLVRTGKLTEQDKLVYEKQIRDDLGVWQSVKRGVGRIPFGAFIEESPIQTPGLLESTQNAFNKTVHGIARSVEDVINIPAGGEAFSAKERLYNKLQEDASMVNLIPRSTFHEAVIGTSHLAGFVIPMMAGGAALRGVKGAEFISNGLMFEGENKSNALKLFPDDPTKQYAYTAIATAGDMMLGHLIPKGDAAKGISKTLKGDIVDVVNKFTNKEITAAEAKQTLLNKTTSLLGDLAKENTKVAGTITGFGVFHNTLDALFGANNMGAGDIATQAVKDFKSTFLTTPILAAMAVKGRASGIDGKILMEVASNPELYKKVIAEQSALNPELKATEKERLQNLEDAALIKKDLDNTEMNDKQKEEFMVTAINKKILERKAAGITDKTLKQSVLDQAEKHDTNLVLLKSEFGDKEFKDLTPEERDRIEPPKDHTVKTQPSGTEGKFTPVIINKKGEHEVLNKSFDTPEAAKVYGEETVKKRYFDENIKNQPEPVELPNLSQPIEGVNEKGIPIGENVPPETGVIDMSLTQKAPSRGIKFGEPMFDLNNPLAEKEINGSNYAITDENLINNGDKVYRLYKDRKLIGEYFNIEDAQKAASEISKSKGQPEQITQPIELSVEPKVETTKTEEVIPPEPPKVELVGEEPGDKKGITHAAIDELRKIIGEPEYEGRPVEDHPKLIAEAQETIKNNPNAANEVLDKMENGGKITNKDNAIMAVYKATIDAEMAKNPTKELLERATRLAKALDVSGTEAGKLLESRKLIGQEDNLTNFLMQKQAAQGTALTENQVKSEAAKYVELKEAKERLEKQLEVEREQHKKDIAELGLNKARAKAKRDAKKSDEEYKTERKAALDAAREALKKLREGGLQSTIPGLRELNAIAPHVKEYLNSLASQGVDKLDNVITQIHAEFKDVLYGLSKKDVLDILAGDYDQKKTQLTKNETKNVARLLQREAKLIKELADAKKGLEKAKSEPKVIEVNRRIDELKKKIEEVKRLNKENTEKEPVEDLTAGSNEDVAKYEQKLLRKIDKLNKDLKEGNYLKEADKEPIFKKTRKAQILEDRVIDLENKIRHERSKDEYNKRSVWRKGFDKVMEVLGIRRLVQSAVDVSVPFRQGATMISPRKIDVWLKGYQANLMSIFSPKKFERIMHEIRNDPMYHEMVKDNVVFNDMGSADPNLHNEDFRKSFIYKIPVISEPLKASNRSADAFLNVARFELYKKLRKNLEQKGLTRESDPKAFKYIGNWAMSMTGRGKMHSALEKPAMNAVLGNTFYGARLMASRFNLLNPVTYFDPRIPKEAKYEAMKDMASFVATTMTVGYALSQVTGAKVSLNPDDADFLQLRYGNKVYDISGGLANYVRTGLRIMKAGYTKATGTKYEGRKAAEKAGKDFVTFFRNKLSPNTAYATDAFFGGRYGQDFEPSDIYAIYPMYTDDFMKAWKEEGGVLATSTVLLPNILGIGYGSYASKGQIDATMEDLLKRNLRSDEMNSEKIINYNDGGRPVTNDEFEKFADKRDAEIGKDIKVLFEKGVGDTPYKDLTPDQVADEIIYIKATATREVKEELFGKEKLTGTEKRDKKKLEKEREKKYKQN